MTKETIEQVLKFRDDRNWKQFHNPKDLARNCWKYFSGVQMMYGVRRKKTRSGKNWRTY